MRAPRARARTRGATWRARTTAAGGRGAVWTCTRPRRRSWPAVARAASSAPAWVRDALRDAARSSRARPSRGSAVRHLRRRLVLRRARHRLGRRRCGAREGWCAAARVGVAHVRGLLHLPRLRHHAMDGAPRIQPRAAGTVARQRRSRGGAAQEHGAAARQHRRLIRAAARAAGAVGAQRGGKARRGAGAARHSDGHASSCQRLRIRLHGRVHRGCSEAIRGDPAAPRGLVLRRHRRGVRRRERHAQGARERPQGRQHHHVHVPLCAGAAHLRLRAAAVGRVVARTVLPVQRARPRLLHAAAHRPQRLARGAHSRRLGGLASAGGRRSARTSAPTSPRPPSRSSTPTTR